ncbi:MAG: PilZ domain-containing protein [Sandaracinaceae bacterium]|jgi:hypothetical protein|nr:PilZ domain-containing protein [Sandaracinaceae bacterium]
MTELLELIYEYRLLRAKEEHLQIALEEEERARIRGIESLLMGETRRASARADSRRAMPRLLFPRAIQFTMPGSFGAGEIANLSGGGAAITTNEVLRKGDRTILRVAVPETGMEYVFPCTVVWTSGSAEANVGIAFTGVPSQTQIARRPSQTFRRPTLCPPTRRPLAA